MKRIILILSILITGCAPAHKMNLDELSGWYVGAPYKTDPLGEEKKPDTDPIYRTDEFDCVTYVETVIADNMGMDTEKNKIAISYNDGILSYANRKHFWEEHNFENISNTLGAKTKTLTQTIDKKKFLANKNIQSNIKKQTFELEYIPTENIYAIDFKHLPDVSIVGIVQKNNPTAFSHVGFVVKTESGIVVRHASKQSERVIEQTWARFIDYQLKLKNRVGIIIWRIENEKV